METYHFLILLHDEVFSLQKLFICEDDNNIWLRVHFNTSPHSEKVDYKDFHWQVELESVETKIWRQFPWKALLGKVPSIRVSLDAWMGALELFHSFVTFLYRWLPKGGWWCVFPIFCLACRLMLKSGLFRPNCWLMKKVIGWEEGTVWGSWGIFCQNVSK